MALKSDMLNAFIEARNYTRYLEVGVAQHENFDRVSCDLKESVDPDPASNPTYLMTSDEFWVTVDSRYDIICIDGLHRGDQVFRDIKGSLDRLEPGGLILLHDCLPETWEEAAPEANGSWTGDVWQGFAAYRLESPYRTFTITEDAGCGIIDTVHEILPFPGAKLDPCSFPGKILQSLEGHYTYLSWDFYCDFKEQLLYPISIEAFNLLYRRELKEI